MELVLNVSIARGLLEGGHVLAARGFRKTVHGRHHVVRGKIEDALLGALQVEGRLGLGRKAQHAALAEPPGRGHGGQVGGSVGVLGGNDDDWCAHVEDCGVDDMMHG